MHRRTEDLLDLTGPTLTPQRLLAVVVTLGSFWAAAEAGLDAWAAAHPAAANELAWSQRRRRHLFVQDAAALGAVAVVPGPAMSAVRTTAAALGRLYVLEGSTLGGQIINSSLAARADSLSAVQLRGLSPYAERTGSMWRDYRRCVTTQPVEDGDAIVAAAVETFAVLEARVVALGPAS